MDTNVRNVEHPAVMPRDTDALQVEYFYKREIFLPLESK